MIYLLLGFMAFGFWLIGLSVLRTCITLLAEIESIARHIYSSLKRIEQLLKPVPAARVVFYTTVNGQLEKVTRMVLKVTQTLPLSVSIQDIKGNAAVVDGAPTWGLTDPALGTVAAAADGLSATLTPAGGLGVCKVQVLADADLGEGVKQILGELDVEFIAGDAATIAIAAGAAVDQ